MNANELRINNLIYYQEVDLTNGNEIWKIYPCDVADIQEVLLMSKKYAPINLTEEWLVKFGFEKAQDKGYLELDVSIGLSIIWLGYLAIEVNGYITSLSEKEQIYVHELQNLVHALTGEELTLKQTDNI